MFSLSSKISLRVSAILPGRPIWLTGRRTEKYPFLKGISAESTWLASSTSVTATFFIMFPFHDPFRGGLQHAVHSALSQGVMRESPQATLTRLHPSAAI